MWGPCLLLLLSPYCLDPALAYSNGKVSVACGDMMPQHGYDPSPNPPPYIITTDTSTFSPGDNITVSLQVNSYGTTFFRGFLIEARAAGKLESPAVGLFFLTDPQESQLLQCGHTQGSGLSHRRASRKTQVQAVWKSPKNPPERVQFLVTVVCEYKVYWLRVAGPVMSLRGVTTSPPTPAPPPPPTASSSSLSTQFSSEGCGLSKSCLREPAGCDPQLDQSCFFLSFTTQQQGHSVMFELSGPAEGYVSFALSLDKWMGNDDVYLCISDGHGVTVSAAYATGRQPPELAQQEALWAQSWRSADGVIQCRFNRNTLLPQLKNRFNLNQSYFLFLAHGRAHQGLVYKHDRQPLISTNQKVITGPPEDLCGSRSALLIKIHGSLMVIAWMWTVSTAVLIARHFKHDWPDATVLGQRLWFQLHRAMMLLAVVLTGVAFTLPFIYRRGWSHAADTHPYIGCTVMALSVLQPIMAIFRPSPESSRRIVFSWMHFITGTAGQILAAVCVFLGAALPALLLPNNWSHAVLTAWVLWILLADLMLLLRACRSRSTGNTGDKEGTLLVQQHGEPFPIAKSKEMVLAVFLLGNTGFLVVLLKAIISV